MYENGTKRYEKEGFEQSRFYKNDLKGE